MGLLPKTAAFSLLAFPAFASEDELVESGMPQLNFDSYASQIFWLVVALVALFFILKSVALPRIASGLEERSDAIEDDLDRAAELIGATGAVLPRCAAKFRHRDHRRLVPDIGADTGF